jgi:hypothetical protein
MSAVANMIKTNPMLAAGATVALVAVVWLTLRGAKGMGADIGGGAVNLAVGVVSGAGNAVVDNALDPSVNPFYEVGTGLGGWIYEITH